MKIAVLSANLGNIDKPVKHTNQLVQPDYFTFTDENFPSRFNSMAPRLQAKIPKMFGWQLKPDYDVYIWMDSNLRFAHHEAVQYFLDAVKDHDMAFLKHPRRDTIHWEYRYTWRGLHSRATSNYITSRYSNELIDEQYEVIKNDPDYVDDLLVNGGVFVYRNTLLAQQMLKEWFYHVCRYQVNDQIPLPYVLKKSGVAYNVLPDDFANCIWLSNERHAK